MRTTDIRDADLNEGLRRLRLRAYPLTYSEKLEEELKKSWKLYQNLEQQLKKSLKEISGLKDRIRRQQIEFDAARHAAHIHVGDRKINWSDYYTVAKFVHPDKGGSTTVMQALNRLVGK